MTRVWRATVAFDRSRTPYGVRSFSAQALSRLHIFSPPNRWHLSHVHLTDAYKFSELGDLK